MSRGIARGSRVFNLKAAMKILSDMIQLNDGYEIFSLKAEASLQRRATVSVG